MNISNPDTISAFKSVLPPVLKVMEYDESFLRWVRENAPDTFVIGRLYEPHQNLGSSIPEAHQLGEQFAEKILNQHINSIQVGGKRLIDAWESYNEVLHSDSPENQHRRYDAFQHTFRGRLNREGFEAVGFNFANGNMMPDQLLTWYQSVLEEYTILGFHEYDWPVMWRMHKETLPVDGGMWLTLRYRRLMEPVIAQYGDRFNVYITEMGMTQGVCGGMDIGWLSHANTTQGCPVDEFPIPAESYWESLKWYHEELLKDRYVKGALIFACGTPGDWASFESTQMMYRFSELT